MEKYAVRTNALKKTYDGGKEAVKGIDLAVPQGSVYAFLGRNGAGKTSTIRMLLGLLERTSGDVDVLGFDPVRNPINVKRRAGYVSEAQKFYDWMTVAELVSFTASFHDGWDCAEADRMLDRFSLPRRSRMKELSRGMAGQVALILAICQRPELLILDDPTSGLDSVVRREYMECVAGTIAAEGRTAFFSTHIIGEIENIADHVGIMRDGMLLVSEPVERLKQRFRRLRLIYDGETPAELPLPGIISKEQAGRELTIVLGDFNEETSARLPGCGAASCELSCMSLEDIFIALAG